MKLRVSHSGLCAPVLKRGAPIVLAAMLSACVNYAGIHGDQHIARGGQFETDRSLAGEQGHWPASDWVDQFGDAQLKALIDEALKANPTIAQAQARIAEANAFAQSSSADLMPRVNASYSLTREEFSGTAIVPPPARGQWRTENNGLLSASYDLDLWGKNREGWKAAVSEAKASEADAEIVKLTLSTSIARAYNELARLYVLRDIAQHELDRRNQIDTITAGRIATGLDTQVERKIAQANVAASGASLKAIDGNIVTTRYELAALIGAGPDRGLSINPPALGVGDDVHLPDNLPADLVSRRPDIVAARWRVDSLVHEVNKAKAEFYPDINLSVAAGFDAFGFGEFLNAASRTVAVGPAIHLPIFDAGALRAQLKGRYAEFDYAVATYNQTLIGALTAVATRLAQIRSSDAQLVDAHVEQQKAQEADQIAIAQYKAGIANQLTVLNADVTVLNADQAVANLKMNRRDQQIALASALGGGYVDTSTDTLAPPDSAMQAHPPFVAAR
ncbi:MarR family transcriptional regulator [Pararobbsia alpina]|uniref:efflux transporter outer membrane subunit n=1 Tax=Pararobbsia alpina TaxID=621374 RepID=UPI0039A6D0E6